MIRFKWIQYDTMFTIFNVFFFFFNQFILWKLVMLILVLNLCAISHLPIFHLHLLAIIFLNSLDFCYSTKTKNWFRFNIFNGFRLDEIKNKNKIHTNQHHGHEIIQAEQHRQKLFNLWFACLRFVKEIHFWNERTNERTKDYIPLSKFNTCNTKCNDEKSFTLKSI